jgi:hypothetical protein
MPQGRASSRCSGAQAAYLERQAYQQPAADPSDYPMNEDPMEARLAQLRALADLKAQGILTDAEFQQQKAAILGSYHPVEG